MKNSFGNILKMHSFGESHGQALGVVIDGVPAGIEFDLDLLQKELLRRRPGQSSITSQRNEADQAQILSGIYQGKTLGTPIAVCIANQDARSKDYQEIQHSARAGHADDVWKNKFGISDPRGGGRSSGRETVSRVIAGAVAQMIFKKISAQTEVIGYSLQIGNFKLNQLEKLNWTQLKNRDEFSARFPSETHLQVRDMLIAAHEQGESFGGIAEILVRNLPANLGQPVFHKLKSDLAQAMMSIGATSAFEIGGGIELSQMKGTELHKNSDAKLYGGQRGGISTGEELSLRVHFKPTSSILDIAKKGRHDPCIVPRAVVVVEAMTWFVLADHLLWYKLDYV